jgi:hypothetical protein
VWEITSLPVQRIRWSIYTPPPFVGIIVPCIYAPVKLLMKIRSEWLSFVWSKAAWEGTRRDLQKLPDCEDSVKRQANSSTGLWKK